MPEEDLGAFTDKLEAIEDVEGGGPSMEEEKDEVMDSRQKRVYDRGAADMYSSFDE